MTATYSARRSLGMAARMARLWTQRTGMARAIAGAVSQRRSLRAAQTSRTIAPRTRRPSGIPISVPQWFGSAFRARQVSDPLGPETRCEQDARHAHGRDRRRQETESPPVAPEDGPEGDDAGRDLRQADERPARRESEAEDESHGQEQEDVAVVELGRDGREQEPSEGPTAREPGDRGRADRSPDEVADVEAQEPKRREEPDKRG